MNIKMKYDVVHKHTKNEVLKDQVFMSKAKKVWKMIANEEKRSLRKQAKALLAQNKSKQNFN